MVPVTAALLQEVLLPPLVQVCDRRIRPVARLILPQLEPHTCHLRGTSLCHRQVYSCLAARCRPLDHQALATLRLLPLRPLDCITVHRLLLLPACLASWHQSAPHHLRLLAGPGMHDGDLTIHSPLPITV